MSRNKKRVPLAMLRRNDRFFRSGAHRKGDFQPVRSRSAGWPKLVRQQTLLWADVFRQTKAPITGKMATMMLVERRSDFSSYQPFIRLPPRILRYAGAEWIPRRAGTMSEPAKDPRSTHKNSCNPYRRLWGYKRSYRRGRFQKPIWLPALTPTGEPQSHPRVDPGAPTPTS